MDKDKHSRFLDK